MRQLFQILAAIVLLSSCGNLKKLSTFEDDAYYDPVRDRKVSKTKAADSTSVVAAPAKKQVADTSNNPYYREPSFNRDDYYDYEYAARIRRFTGNSMGVAYYDPYYTNSYFYDSNPYHYGVSIYNGYNWYGPGYWNYSYNPTYNWGGWNGCGNNYNWGYYNYPSSYFNSPSPWSYGYGYNDYYGNGYNNNWWYWNNQYWNNSWYNNDPYNHWCNNNNTTPGYFNSYDYNSYYYGPRQSHAGMNPVLVNPSNGNKMQSGEPDNSTPVVAAPAPYDPERFNTIQQPVKNVNTQNYQTPSTVTQPATPVWDSKPENTYGNTQPNTNTVTTTAPVSEPKKGFWGRVLTGTNDGTVKSNENSTYNNNDVMVPDNNSNSGSTATPKKNTTQTKSTYSPNTPKSPKNTSTAPAKNNDTYSPPKNNTPVYTPKNNYTPPSTPQNNGGGTQVKKPR